MKKLTLGVAISGLLLGGGVITPVSAGVKTSVVAEFGVGPSYPNFSGASTTLIQRKNDEGKVVEFRAIVKRDNTAYIKFLPVEKLGDIKLAIYNVASQDGWKDYGYYFLCDLPDVDISVGEKDLSITAFCAPRPEDGKALPEPSEGALKLQDLLNQISNMTVNSYDAVTEVEPQKAIEVSKFVTYNIWLENVWIPTDPHAETRDLIRTDWGYEGSSTRLRAFEDFYKVLGDKFSVYEYWLENVWNPTGPHIETQDLIRTKWGYEGSSTKLNAFESFYGKFENQ
ncbi:hypothetical protein BTA51_16130 [Hahella sp. CCB-MM4]|uniref:hypothetical protein n=1 Tax=Hahella sp. (strain CCB-MM4) TaxID=1926491 RepID=UPI000B9AD5A1|nr:hypothetical protein [Hahella sp. CCB-MM4]OZG72267.1 hypothetical protein BTA51_16130 [Hahella sp. CCB-MM4]